MGGKRPDQHNIAAGEAGSTDYKRYPESRHGKNQDQDTVADKQRLAQSRQDAAGQPFPPDVPAPGLDVNRAREVEEDDEESTPPAARSKSGQENPLA